MDIHVPSTPRHLKVTPTMIDDFIIDPVMGAKIILGREYDYFQAIRMRYYWWVPEVIDSSGFSTLKTGVFWDFINLRCVIIGDQICGVYYQSFGTGKDTFWTNYRRRHHPIFAAQLGQFTSDGEEDGKANTKDASCYHQHFKNGSEVKMPAPSWGQDAKTQASLRYNVIGIDEWTKVESMKSTEKAGEVGGINKQILGRLTRESRNKNHPIWCNHQLFLATAEHQTHPAYHRYRSALKRIATGDPNTAVLSFCYKDYSNKKQASGITFKEQYRIEQTINRMKAEFTADHFKREVLGLWAAHGKGWYNEDDLRRCIEVGRSMNLLPAASRDEFAARVQKLSPEELHFFLGIDPAPALGQKSDDGALAALAVWPKDPANPGLQPADWHQAFPWAYKLRGASPRQWSGLIHSKHAHFGFTGINVDAGAGGQGPSIMLTLKELTQLIEGVPTQVRPISCPDDTSVADAAFILTFFKRRDSTVEMLWPSHTMPGDDNLWHNCHTVFQEAIEHATVALPVPYNERPGQETKLLTKENDWALRVLSQGVEQLKKIVVLMKEDGTMKTTGHGALTFLSNDKKDIAYAMMLAYVRFLIWLKSNDGQFSVKGEDAGLCSVM